MFKSYTKNRYQCKKLYYYINIKKRRLPYSPTGLRQPLINYGGIYAIT